MWHVWWHWANQPLKRRAADDRVLTLTLAPKKKKAATALLVVGVHLFVVCHTWGTQGVVCSPVGTGKECELVGVRGVYVCCVSLRVPQKKRTTPSVPKWSPTSVLTEPNEAYLPKLDRFRCSTSLRRTFGARPILSHKHRGLASLRPWRVASARTCAGPVLTGGLKRGRNRELVPPPPLGYDRNPTPHRERSG